MTPDDDQPLVPELVPAPDDPTVPSPAQGEPGLIPAPEDPTAPGEEGDELGDFDMGSLFQAAGAMQEQILAAQQEAAQRVLEGVAGGGVVKVQVTGGLEFQSVTIDPAAVDPSDVEMLQDLVLAAVRDAVDQVNELQAGALGLGDLDLGGLDLGGLLGGT